ncbi:MAG: hypothetical protein L0I76_29530, partial [Pseudonocardia sp.]|nr:hypothetical protein [Pseudonocardia sp.]
MHRLPAVRRAGNGEAGRRSVIDAAARGPACDRGGRLELARGLLRRMEDRSERPHTAPVPGEDHRLLPVSGPLVPLLPGGGLRRGSTVSV